MSHRKQMKLIASLLLLPVVGARGQGTKPLQIQITQPTVSSEGVPTGPASVCAISGRSRECYTAAKDGTTGVPFGLNPQAQQMALKPGLDAILFTARASAGGSGSRTILALLVSKHGRLDNLLPDVTISEQSEYRMWKEPTISELPLVITANYVSQDAEAHFAAHHFRISTYRFGSQLQNYVLQDEYITAKKYMDTGQPMRILEQERQEILTRLRRQTN